MCEHAAKFNQAFTLNDSIRSLSRMGKEEIDAGGIIIIILCSKRRQWNSSNNGPTGVGKKLFHLSGSRFEKIECKNCLNYNYQRLLLRVFLQSNNI